MHDADQTAAQVLTELTALNQRKAALADEVDAHRRTASIMGTQQRMLVCTAKAVPFLLYVYDLIDPCVLYVNDRSVMMLGYTADEIHAQGSAFFRHVLHPDDFAYLSGELPRRFATAQDGDVIETEYRIQHANGRWCWLFSRDVVLARSAGGAPRQILGTAQDITKRKRVDTRKRTRRRGMAR